MIQFATKKNLKQPVGGLILDDKDDRDHVLGGLSTEPSGESFEVLQQSGQWLDFIPAYELQRNRYGDTFMCVSYSNNNICEFLLKRRYGEDCNFSDIFLGVGSGTKPGRGNGKRTVAEWRRKNGSVPEEDYPYTQEMTLAQVYKPIPKAILQEGLGSLVKFDYFYKWLGGNSTKRMIDGLQFSPLQVDIYGSYPMNSKNYVVWQQGMVYNHEVVIFGYELGECWYVFDSETEQYLKFVWNYPFGNPMIHSIKKKNIMTIFKKKELPTLAIKHCSKDSLIAFSGGSVDGWELFQSIYGVSSLDELAVEIVDEWPYPIENIIYTQPQR